MRRLPRALIATVSVIGFAQIALAADVAPPVYKAPPPAPPLQDWSGVYVGLEGGYGWGKRGDVFDPGAQLSPAFVSVFPPATTLQLVNAPFFFPDAAIPSIKQNGWLFGGFFGAQKQWGSWVLGIEGDIDAAEMKGSGTSNASSAVTQLTVPISVGPAAPPFPFTLVCPGGPCLTLNHDLSIDSKIDMLASLRGKVGWSFAPNWLIYGTGGAAFAHVENTVSSRQSVAVNPVLNAPIFLPTPPTEFRFKFDAPSPLSASGGATMFGWAAGAGVDWKLPLDAGSALVFGFEYLHYEFPEQTITVSNKAGGSFAFNTKEHVDTVKGRISYLFSIH